MFLSTFSVTRAAVRRAISAAAVSAALLTVAVSSTSAAPAQQPAQPAGTVVGSVSCGASDQSPAASALVQVAGADLSTRAAGDGRFILDNVPAGPVFTVTALSDPLGSDISGRPNVSLTAGETLDIGNLDLTACPAPLPADAQVESPSSTQDSPSSTQD